MRNKAVYFPYIRVPENAWFSRVLLYWDEVGAIVPSEFIQSPERLGAYMAGLVRAGLVRQLIPGQFVYKAPRFVEAFLEFLDARPVPFRRGGIWQRIHMEKLGDLPDELVARKLAVRSESPWCEVEPTTAAHFMAYLACVIGQMQDDGGYAAITDQVVNLAALTPLHSRVADPLETLRAVVLERTLPAPVSARPDDLAAFKAKHSGLLRRFRARVESVVTELAAIPDDDARTARLNAASNEMEAEISEIRARLCEGFASRIGLGTLCSVLASVIPGAQAFMTGDPLSAITAGAGLAAAVCSAVQERRSKLPGLQEPLAYAALAQESLR